MAKADAIPQLAIFRGHCKPIWLFISSGEPTGVVHGANAPLLGRMIQREMDRLKQVMNGEAQPQVIALEDCVPKKSFTQSDNNASVQMDGQMFQCLKEIKTSRNSPTNDSNKNFALLLIEEYIKDMGSKTMEDITKFLEDKEMMIMRQKESTLSQEDVQMFASGSDIPAQQLSPLIGTNCKILLLRCKDESVNAHKRIQVMLGPKSGTKVEKKKGIPHSENLRHRYFDPEEFSIGFMCPDYSGFLQLMDKHFLESLKTAYDPNFPDGVLFVFEAELNEDVMATVRKEKIPMKVKVDFKIQNREVLKDILHEVHSKEDDSKADDSKANNAALEGVEKLKDLLEDTENIDPDRTFVGLLVDNSGSLDALLPFQPLAVSSHPGFLSHILPKSKNPKSPGKE
eukprot:TCALIF_12295-PB protein Name:"Similar to NME9 Thioredoxin domain-containing protein 6 (Homo sapiens)" AED:0.00 eAED:0.00 QI:36/1/1/1/0.85/0.62/8/191/397